MDRFSVFLWALLIWTWAADGAEVYRTSFETGQNAPDGWAIVRGKGEWSQNGRNGGRCLALFGKGDKSSFGTWRLQGFPFKPNQHYRITFYTWLDSKEGLVAAGTHFCRRYFRAKGWEKATFVFRAPSPPRKEDGFTFYEAGANGTCYLDDLRLEEVFVRHREENGLVLSADEKIEKGVYTFESHFEGERSNDCRVEVSHTVGFENQTQWFAKDATALYRFSVGSYPQLSATLRIRIGGCWDGEVVIKASKDEKSWREIARHSGTGEYSTDLPADLFPAQVIFIHVTGTGNLQVPKYIYSAKLGGSPPDRTGETTVYSGHTICADNGEIALLWQENVPELVTVQRRERSIGALYGTLAQFEKKGIGYKGTGVGVAGIERVKSVSLTTREPDTCVVDVTAERTESAETMRKYEATYRFTLHAGEPWFEARLLSVKNTDAVGFKAVGYCHRLQPQEPAGFRPASYGGWAAWLGKELSLVAMPGQEGDSFQFGFWRDERGVYGDVTRPLSAELAPQQLWTCGEPGIVVYVGPAEAKGLAREVGRCRDRLEQPKPSPPSKPIAYTEENCE